MSAIGSYVHYRAKNYDKYGTSMKNHFDSIAYNYQKEDIKKQMNMRRGLCATIKPD